MIERGYTQWLESVKSMEDHPGNLLRYHYGGLRMLAMEVNCSTFAYIPRSINRVAHHAAKGLGLTLLV